MASSIEKLVPPGGSPEWPQAFQAPDVRVGGFLDEFAGEAVVPEVVVPYNADSGKPMSPVESSTGVPLPIVGAMGKSPNRHHAHFYERRYVKGTRGQQAVRQSRLQRVGRYAHAQYHRRFDGTAMPGSSAEEYEITVLNCAGYVPEFGVRVAKHQIRVTELTARERKQLRRPHTFSQENGSGIADFLLEYALDQDFNEAKQLYIEEFLSLTPEKIAKDNLLHQRKLFLAEKLTNKAIGLALDPINPIFSEARRARKLRNNAPSSAWEVVRERVQWKIPKYTDKLEDRLATQFGV